MKIWSQCHSKPSSLTFKIHNKHPLIFKDMSTKKCRIVYHSTNKGIVQISILFLPHGQQHVCVEISKNKDLNSDISLWQMLTHGDFVNNMALHHHCLGNSLCWHTTLQGNLTIELTQGYCMKCHHSWPPEVMTSGEVTEMWRWLGSMWR